MQANASQSAIPRHALVLAAGLGTRMRPLTDHRPKPLIEVAGTPLIDHVLDRLAEVGVERAVVNVHYQADLIEQHLRSREHPQVLISDERDALLDTGGGAARALPLLGDAPFLLLNSDTLWVEAVKPNLARLAGAFDPIRMDALLLVASTIGSIGYTGRGDFRMAVGGELIRRGEREVAPFVYAGAALLAPRLFVDAPAGAFSLNLLFDRAAEAGRLFGLRLEGVWLHVGTPDAVVAAEQAMLASVA
jgi:MurNAc alpha-1-phosphate uridylyltransferase